MKKAEARSLTLTAPLPTNNLFNYWSGLLLQVANKVRRSLIGYTSAGGSDDLSPVESMQYNQQVLNGWLRYWEEYEGQAVCLKDKNILELGPGADLGLGTLALAKGAHKYYALDVFELASGKSFEYYLEGLQHVEVEEGLDSETFDLIIRQAQLGTSKHADRFKYVIHPDFNLKVFQENEIDCVFSNAAFQQFDDPVRTIAQLGKVVKPGGLFLSCIDFTSHTRWIRDRDPLNIYRYPDFVYKTLRFRGSPNRFHTQEYQKALKEHEWKDIQFYVMEAYPKAYVNEIQKSFHKPFNDENRDMSVATIIICARNGKSA